MDAYFAYVEDEGGAFRLVFESDLTNEPAVREAGSTKVALQWRRGGQARSSRRTPGPVPRNQSMLAGRRPRAASPRSSPAYWLASGSDVPRDTAVQLLTSLAWRGIRRLPAARHRGPPLTAPIPCGYAPVGVCFRSRPLTIYGFPAGFGRG